LVSQKEVDVAGLEGFELDRIVGVVAVDDLVEVVEAAPHAFIARPVVRVANEVDPPPVVGPGDEVGAGADRKVVDDLAERLALAVGTIPHFGREHPQERAEGVDAVAAAHREVETNRSRIDHDGAARQGERRRNSGIGWSLTWVSNEYFTSAAVTGSPFVKCARGFDAEAHDEKVGSDQHRLGDEAVHHAGLVLARVAQRLEREEVRAVGIFGVEQIGIERAEARPAVGVAEV
jgi:hypothetical protein